MIRQCLRLFCPLSILHLYWLRYLTTIQWCSCSVRNYFITLFLLELQRVESVVMYTCALYSPPLGCIHLHPRMIASHCLSLISSSAQYGSLNNTVSIRTWLAKASATNGRWTKALWEEGGSEAATVSQLRWMLFTPFHQIHVHAQPQANYLRLLVSAKLLFTLLLRAFTRY